ncbi:hypothetical protein G5714_020395 [Onychostoma macrolepis]|uniref:Uncharacterized protein n=1 Tax=Onychostoma macrolepis TaxID=369639 RepID=A0A7J6BVM8_9TELE|nr:hypothetical protein G5714_020395 [Onychostoma macrolepis]
MSSSVDSGVEAHGGSSIATTEIISRTDTDSASSGEDGPPNVPPPLLPPLAPPSPPPPPPLPSPEHHPAPREEHEEDILGLSAVPWSVVSVRSCFLILRLLIFHRLLASVTGYWLPIASRRYLPTYVILGLSAVPWSVVSVRSCFLILRLLIFHRLLASVTGYWLPIASRRYLPTYVVHDPLPSLYEI